MIGVPSLRRQSNGMPWSWSDPSMAKTRVDRLTALLRIAIEVADQIDRRQLLGRVIAQHFDQRRIDLQEPAIEAAAIHAIRRVGASG